MTRASDLESALALPGPLALDRARVDADPKDEVLRLFDECAPGLRRYLFSFGFDAPTVDDLVQDVFLALYRHLCLGRSRANLKSWIFQVGHNLALRQRQQARRRPVASLTADAAETIVDPAGNPEERMADSQRQRRLRSVMRALPVQDRRCLCLRAEGLRYREIARLLGISLGSVAKSIARGLGRLTSADEG